MTITVNSTPFIITFNVIETANDAVQYAIDDATCTIAGGVLVASHDHYGVFSNKNSSTLINNGTIFSGNFGGVGVSGANCTIVNNAGRNIAGYLSGIDLNGDGATVTNHGRVSGYGGSGILFNTSSNQVVLNNDGEIYGYAHGVEAFSDFDGGTINNTGTIQSDNVGIRISTSPGLVTFIDNRGSIAGAEAAIFTLGLGRISLTNSGTIDGQIHCTASSGNVDDLVVNRGTIKGEVHLGDGADSFNGKGGSSGTIFGEDGNDTLKGGSHKDVLVGGLDMDHLTGGANADKFVFNAVLESVQGTTHDSILDFSHAQHDKIDLHLIDANNFMGGDQAFHFIGAKNFSLLGGELRYANHLLQADVDGNGAADIEIHVNAAHLTKGDFVL